MLLGSRPVRQPRRRPETTSIRPFPKTQVPQQAIDELRRRIAATQWPEKETVADSSQGVPLATMQELARYWATDYDWRKVEAKLNALPQFVTNIDGLDIHFIHVRSRRRMRLPLIITHGWPGSVLEQTKLIGPLTDPTAHGGKAKTRSTSSSRRCRATDFPASRPRTGWGPERMARAWAELMKRLGYHALRRPRRRLGCVRRRSDGFAGAAGTARHPHQHARDGSSRRRQGAPDRRSGASRSLGRGTAGLRAARSGRSSRSDYARYDGVASADALRHRGFTGRPRRLASRPQ